jgi:peptide/nickel transport system substrate-binding protein
MFTLRKRGISTPIIVGVAVVIVIIIVAGVFIITQHSVTSSSTTPTQSSSSQIITTTLSTSLTTTQTTTSATQSTSGFHLTPQNSSVFVDDSNTGPPDSLDPAVGIYLTDVPFFNAVFQELVEFNGSSETQVVPVLASNYTVENNYQTYIFSIRPGVAFSTGDRLTAADVWFSLTRMLYIGYEDGNFGNLTINLSTLSATGLSLPWGVRAAIQQATGLPATTNSTIARLALNNILSNFDPNNATIQKVMAYPKQVFVVPSSMVFEVHLLNHYRFFIQELAVWWAAIVDPAFVDAHGGVQANTQNNYFNVNSGPGTGPYVTESIGPTFSDIVLEINPAYWGLNATNIPMVAEPPHIPVIIINYGLEHTDRVEEFAANHAQLSYVGNSFLGQMYSSYQYKKFYSFNDIFDNLGLYPNLNMLGMNTQKYPTSNTNFRLAVVHAINYTQLLDTYSFNGSTYAENYLGPITPGFGAYYDPGNLSLYSYNDNLAVHYLNLAGEQEDFSVTLPNGTVIGNTSAPPLAPITIDYSAPLTPFTQLQLTIIQSDLSKIGLAVGLQGFPPSEYYSFDTPQDSPNMALDGWVASWDDPVLQELVAFITPTYFYTPWMNVSRVNQILSTLPFLTNQTQQIQLIKEVYNITYWYAPGAWLPDPDLYFFIQPYVQGLIYNMFVAYWYNTIYYATS